MVKEKEYDVCLSFAGENRDYVNDVAYILKDKKVKVFYDDFESVDLWGTNIREYFGDVYQNKSKYCVIFVSENYMGKYWTNHELEHAVTRALKENREYILPARFDDTELPGISNDTGYIDLRRLSAMEFAEIIIEKTVGSTTPEYKIPEEGELLNKYFESSDQDMLFVNKYRDFKRNHFAINETIGIDEQKVNFSFPTIVNSLTNRSFMRVLCDRYFSFTYIDVDDEEKVGIGFSVDDDCQRNFTLVAYKYSFTIQEIEIVLRENGHGLNHGLTIDNDVYLVIHAKSIERDSVKVKFAYIYTCKPTFIIKIFNNYKLGKRQKEAMQDDLTQMCRASLEYFYDIKTFGKPLIYNDENDPTWERYTALPGGEVHYYPDGSGNEMPYVGQKVNKGEKLGYIYNPSFHSSIEEAKEGYYFYAERSGYIAHIKMNEGEIVKGEGHLFVTLPNIDDAMSFHRIHS